MNNPLIRRYQYSLLRPHQVWIFGILYVSIIALVLFINLAIYQKQKIIDYMEPWELFQTLAIQFLFFQAILLWILAPYNVSTVIPGEILEKSHDFSRMLPLSACQKALGILIGRNLIIFLLAFLNFLFLVAFSAAGRVPWSLQVQLILLLFSICVLICLIALLSSMHPFQKKGNSFLAVLIILFFFGFGPLIGSVIEIFEEDHIKTPSALFYIWEIPLILVICGITLYFAVWAFIGVLRWFTREYDPLFSPGGAILFLPLYLVLLLGLFYPYLVTNKSCLPGEMTAENLYSVYYCLGLIPVALLPLGVRRSYEKYLELSRLYPPEKLSLPWLLRKSNLSLAACLFLTWGIFCLGVGILAGQNVQAFLIKAGVLFTFYMVLTFMLETYITCKPVSPKLMYLMGFLLILYVVFPFVLSGLFDQEHFSVFSPVGYLIFSHDRYLNLKTHLAPLFFNCFLCAAMVTVILLRYYRIIAVRYGMASPAEGRQSASL